MDNKVLSPYELEARIVVYFSNYSQNLYQQIINQLSIYNQQLISNEIILWSI